MNRLLTTLFVGAVALSWPAASVAGPTPSARHGQAHRKKVAKKLPKKTHAAPKRVKRHAPKR
jgi:hypothetical protein